jgi:hypothetical protein
VPISVTYTATLGIDRETVLFLAALLREERRRRGTRRGRRAITCFTQAVLILRWFLDNTQITQLANDHGISGTTAYLYLHEGIDVLAAHAPDLRSVLEDAKKAGLTHVNLDGIVIATDRVAAPGPNGADLWWSGKHKHHGGNIQVISAPDGWPLWVSEVRPGREHDITCARHHDVIATLAAVRADLPSLADLGYEGAADASAFRSRRRPVSPGSTMTSTPTTSCSAACEESASGRTPCSPSHSRPYAG